MLRLEKVVSRESDLDMATDVEAGVMLLVGDEKYMVSRVVEV